LRDYRLRKFPIPPNTGARDFREFPKPPSSSARDFLEGMIPSNSSARDFLENIKSKHPKLMVIEFKSLLSG